jgi:DNA-binding GntR family transcriptional regulator
MEKTQTLYDRVVQHVFTPDLLPGTRLVERQLADELGVSRVPLRECLARLVAQGALVGGDGRQGVRVRDYSATEIRQLYELREMIEGGAARGAAKAATDDELNELGAICKLAEKEIGNYGSARWADLDQRFHNGVAAASHNGRYANALCSMLAECYYVFYLYLPQRARVRPTAAEATKLMRRVAKDHRALLDRVCARDADGAEKVAREHMRISADLAAKAMIESGLGQ